MSRNTGSPQNEDGVADLAGEVADDQPQSVAQDLAHDQVHEDYSPRGLGLDGTGGTDASQMFAPHLPQVVGLHQFAFGLPDLASPLQLPSVEC